MSIILTGTDAANFRKQLLHPDDEHIKMRDEIFRHIDDTISIRKDGDTIVADCKELDLSELDLSDCL